MKLHGFAAIASIWVTLAALLIHTESAQPPFSCDSSNPSTRTYPFCNKTLPIPHRVQDLVTRLTLDEKVSQLVNSAPSIPRLGVSAYQWWSEALHGVSRHGKGVQFNGTIKSATMFPQVILTAAAFDSHLWYRIGQAIAVEARAMYNEGQAMGMTFWAPNINVFRDPRWGRGQETPGEDPLVTGRYAVSYVRGIQGDSIRGGKLKDGHLQASACCKHFTAYDLDSWTGVNRFGFDAHVILSHSLRLESVLLFDVTALSGIRYIASDCDAVAIIHDVQGYAKLPEDAVVDVLTAGMDVNCGSYLKKYTKSAVQQKKLSESEIDRALHNLFTVRMRLGLFNGSPNEQLMGNIRPDRVCTQENQDLALEAARNGIVLLKNSARLLPLLRTEAMSLAVIGPNANVTQTLLGNYEGPPCKNVTILQALQGYMKNTMYHQGCNAVNCTSVAINEAVNIAKNTDYVILVMGLDQSQERESHDRVDLVLPGKQKSLILSVAKAAKKPIVLVLLSGGPVDVSFAKDHKKIGSILWAGYPGEAGGIAIAEIIFGDQNPGGRLPMTWYPKDYIRIVQMTDMRMRPDPSTDYPGRTYRFYNGTKVFEFGHGLSYSNYIYEFKSVTKKKLHFDRSSTAKVVKNSVAVGYLVSEMATQLCHNSKFSVTVAVENAGEMAGKHPVLLFARPAKLTNGNAMKRLVGFRTVSLGAGGRAEVKFTLNPCEHLSEANKDGFDGD
ncbi:hypothetical protein RJ640_001879 [Escallonia rubra]|uniref:Beta-D-xylosidase 7 n=1 Tax=Escallonia rubra TaxID=112253 RepID=A0AA88S2P9_9ASTE|nr:hypothetical protein RJ640_001879 [Escallonia rubra]